MWYLTWLCNDIARKVKSDDQTECWAQPTKKDSSYLMRMIMLLHIRMMQCNDSVRKVRLRDRMESTIRCLGNGVNDVGHINRNATKISLKYS